MRIPRWTMVLLICGMYAPSVAADTEPVNHRLRRALLLSELGNFSKALADFDEVLKAQPGFGEAYLERGNAYLKAHEFDSAIRDFEQAKKLSPQSLGKLADARLNEAAQGKTSFFLRIHSIEDARVDVDGRDHGIQREIAFDSVEPDERAAKGLQIHFPDGGVAFRAAPVRRGLTVDVYARAPSRLVLLSKVDKSDESALSTMLADGSQRKRLSRGLYDQPALSPDGTQIAMLRRHAIEGSSELLTMDVDGSNSKVVALGVAGSFTWSADGTTLAFDRKSENMEWSTYVVGIHSLLREKLLARGRSPHWSPDGKRLLLMRERDSRAYVYEVYRDGKNEREIAEGSSATYSPDGRRIALIDGKSKLLVMNADGTDSREVGSAYQDKYRWSPDGLKIAFRKHSAKSTVNLYTVDVDAGNINAITSFTQADANAIRTLAEELRLISVDVDNFCWSPDGRHLFFTWKDVTVDLDKLVDDFDITGYYTFRRAYVINADGSNRTQLSTDADFAVQSDWR